MAVTFKVVETFHLVEGADLTDLQRAIDIVQDIPFDLSQPAIDRGVRFVKLVRDGDAQSEEPEPMFPRNRICFVSAVGGGGGVIACSPVCHCVPQLPSCQM